MSKNPCSESRSKGEKAFQINKNIKARAERMTHRKEAEGEQDPEGDGGKRE